MGQQTVMGGRVAFFGGSFDPPHEGHLAIARAARAALALDVVLFAPVGAQPLKPDGSSAAFDDRLAMTQLAIAREAGFAVSLLDAPRVDGAPNYTFETLLQLKEEVGPAGSVFFLMGADSFLGLHRWHRAAEIPFVAPLIVASRPGQPLDGLISALPDGVRLAAPEVPAAAVKGARQPTGAETLLLADGSGATAPLYLLAGLDFDVSASQVRAQIHGRPESPGGASVAVPVPAAVMQYIRMHGLYR